MSAATHVEPVPSAGEPSPLEAAQEAALKARRAAAALHGLWLFAVGLEVLVFGAVMFAGSFNRFLAQDLLPLPLGLGAACTLFAGFAYTRRKRAGLTAAVRAPLPETERGKGLLLTLVLLGMAGLGASTSMLYRADTSTGEHVFHVAVIGVFYAAGLAVLHWAYARSRLREILTLAAAYLAMPAFFVLAVTSKDPDGAPFWAGLGALSIGTLVLLAGASLELRWRAFVRCVPKEDAA